MRPASAFYPSRFAFSAEAAPSYQQALFIKIIIISCISSRRRQTRRVLMPLAAFFIPVAVFGTLWIG
jgi:hypothetical protein